MNARPPLTLMTKPVGGTLESPPLPQRLGKGAEAWRACGIELEDNDAEYGRRQSRLCQARSKWSGE